MLIHDPIADGTLTPSRFTTEGPAPVVAAQMYPDPTAPGGWVLLRLALLVDGRVLWVELEQPGVGS